MRVSMQEFIDRFDDLADRADAEPVMIAQGDRDRLVLVSAEEYIRLKERKSAAVAASEEGVPTSPDETHDGEMPSLWGALRHTITYIADDIAEPIGDVWKAER